MSAGVASRVRRRWLAWAILAVGWACLIFVLSAEPNLQFVPDEGWDFAVRKVGHMAVFGLLAVLVWRTAAETSAISRPATLALAVTILYAITDEIHQGFTAGRYPSVRDVGVDAVGAVLALLAARWIAGRWSRSSVEAPRNTWGEGPRNH